MTYEYACAACGHQWEAEQSIKDSPLKTCVSCRKNTAKRLVSGGTGFLLKGGGWYADGYGSKSTASSGEASASKSSTADSGGAADSGTSGEGKAKKDANTSSTAESKSDTAAKPAAAPAAASAKAS